MGIVVVVIAFNWCPKVAGSQIAPRGLSWRVTLNTNLALTERGGSTRR